MNPEATSPQAAALDDRSVADRVLGGELQLFELLMRRYNQRLFRIARSYVSDPSEAEDIVQETYLRAYARLDQFRGPSFGAWAARIAAHEALGRLRRRHVQLVEEGPEAPAADPHWAPARPAPDHLAGRTQLLVLIEAAVDALPRDFRTVFMLRAVEQLSVEETAAHLGLEPATVKTRFHRAKARLQAKLSRQLDERSGEVFPFGASRCDQLVARVLERLGGQRPA